MKHTKGPWYISQTADYAINALDGRHIAMVSCFEKNKNDATENLGDAALIAAAPELLEALKELVEELEGEYFNFSVARAAIAKAEGL